MRYLLRSETAACPLDKEMGPLSGIESTLARHALGTDARARPAPHELPCKHSRLQVHLGDALVESLEEHARLTERLRREQPTPRAALCKYERHDQLELRRLRNEGTRSNARCTCPL